MTNPKNPQKILTCTHKHIWELCVESTHQDLFSIKGESNQIVDPLIMAASLYANTYLEKGSYTNKNLQGRFYWAGFATFTYLHTLKQLRNIGVDIEEMNENEETETLKELFDTTGMNTEEIKNKYSSEDMRAQINKYIINDTEKYAFWLCLDILSTHRFWKIDENSFTIDEPKNSVFEEDNRLHKDLSSLPWFDESVNVIKKANTSHSLYQAFHYIRHLHTYPISQQEEKQFNHLFTLSEHIQRHIASPLIYKKNNVFSAIYTLNQQVRKHPDNGTFSLYPMNDVMPEMDPIFIAPLEHTDPPSEIARFPQQHSMNSYAYQMKMIKESAEKYHQLMHLYTDEMEKEIEEVAAWIEFHDSSSDDKDTI